MPPTDLPSPPLDAEAAARMIWRHWTSEVGIDALPPGLRPATRTQGHAIQAALPSVAGCKVVGWKIAATSAAGQAHINVGGPIAGRILDAELVAHDDTAVSLAGNRMRVVEPEFAFRFGAALAPRERPYGVDEVLAAVASLHPAFEAPNSRFADFARAGEAQLQADNACSGRFLFGGAAPDDWRRLDLATYRVQARVQEAGGAWRYAREGDGSAVLGDPRVALAWLVNELRGLGIALRSGDTVSTGTCMKPLEVQAGDRVEADFGRLGRLAIRLSP